MKKILILLGLLFFISNYSYSQNPNYYLCFECYANDIAKDITFNTYYGIKTYVFDTQANYDYSRKHVESAYDYENRKIFEDGSIEYRGDDFVTVLNPEKLTIVIYQKSNYDQIRNTIQDKSYKDFKQIKVNHKFLNK